MGENPGVVITFRTMTDDDLPVLHRWLNDPEIVRWWEGDDVTWDGVVTMYGRARRAGDETEHWIAELNGRALGWIQLWDARTEPDEVAPWLALGVDPTSGGIDYLVGAGRDRGRGVGTAMISAFVPGAFERHPEYTQLAAAPHEANTRSWGALEGAGFRHVGDVPDPDGIGRLMVIDR